MKFAGYEDWRVPHIIELYSLVVYDDSNSNEFDGIELVFRNPGTGSYNGDRTWASTFRAGAEWMFVQWNYGMVFSLGSDGLMSVRLVRGGK